MRRVTNPAATPVVLRGLLVLMVAAVGLLCLLGRASPHNAVPSEGAAVSRVAVAQVSAVDAGGAPCGKKLVVNEHITPRADAAPQTVPVPGSVRSPDCFMPTEAGSGAAFSRGSPTPPSSVASFSVLRM
ncbi:hypothetical protein OG292_00070 [Streptomyces sp. NBC_01511]|uniref:hypothetical protein n=1 Tax=Streptomyces sp. NBC_01511 TaxID=2903889 RepID=UPI00386FCFE7